jgi:hypothetical protein
MNSGENPPTVDCNVIAMTARQDALCLLPDGSDRSR